MARLFSSFGLFQAWMEVLAQQTKTSQQHVAHGNLLVIDMQKRFFGLCGIRVW